MRFTPWFFVALVSLVGTANDCAQTAAAGTKRALLVGINTYQPAATTAKHTGGCHGGRCDLPVFPNLNGPLNDVAAMRDLLSSPKFGFAPENIAVLTNPGLPKSPLGFVTVAADQTNHAALLATMHKYLVELPHKGDTVVFYYAGHGSLRVNSKGTKLEMLVDGKATHADSTLVPADAWTGTVHDVRDRETTRIFNGALEKGVNLTVILDSCHSGSFTRGVELGKPFVERSLGYDPDDIQEGPDLLPNGQPVPPPAEREKNPALIFSAAQQDQTAKERVFGDDPKTATPHGAFTLALIQALETLPEDAPAAVVYQHVRAALEAEGVPDQNPSLDSGKDRLNQPLFGGVTSANHEIRAASIGVDDEGQVLLDAGQLAGIDIGSEFKSINETGPVITLRVESLDGLTHSIAKVKSPAGAHVAVPQVFRLSKWVPRQVDALHFWTWPANLSLAQLDAVEKQVTAAGFHPIEDPVEEPWTDMLAWNGSAWELHHGASDAATQARTTPLGGTITAAALKANLAPEAKLWVNLPPASELAAKLKLHEQNSLVIGVDDVTRADYLLAGTMTDDGPGWAWFHKAEYLAGPRTAVTHDHSAGCSTKSPYPVSSDWVYLQAGAEDATERGSDTLNTYSGLLAKVNGWLNLASNPSVTPPPAYFHLQFKRLADDTILPANQPVKQDDRFKMVLAAKVPVYEQRWVYVLDIDCHGKGTLLYPRGSSGGRFPSNADGPHVLDLTGAPNIRIGGPFGVDTILMITTQVQLPDPWALEFSGVGTRGGEKQIPPGAMNPLQQLLTNTSAGTRGALPEMPTNWSIDTFALTTVPK